VFAFWIARVWERFKDRHWRNAIQAGLVPLSIGFMAASAYVVTRAADISYVAAAITAIVAVLMYFSKANPLLLLAAGGAIGTARSPAITTNANAPARERRAIGQSSGRYLTRTLHRCNAPVTLLKASPASDWIWRSA
jgi:chromate transport protein ChrA